MIIRNPSAYHGNKHKRPVFEGWYHKLTTKNNRSLAIIPGIYHSGKSNNNTAFIMVLALAQGVEAAADTEFRKPTAAEEKLATAWSKIKILR